MTSFAVLAESGSNFARLASRACSFVCFFFFHWSYPDSQVSIMHKHAHGGEKRSSGKNNGSEKKDFG
jgi:hypothetical protein